MTEVRIGIDAMGGDHAPEVVVLGAIEASKRLKEGSKIVLFGDAARIEAVMDREGCPKGTFEIVHTTQVIEMSDNPAQTFLKKPDSSIAVGFKQLMAGEIHGFASAGSTGAMMVGCMYTVKQIEGVIRPAISTVVSTTNGKEVMILDVGLNVDCKPEVLYQYGVIGSIYARSVMKVENPRVALLNIGEEKEKGDQQTKATYELMEGTTAFNFVGNVEGKHIFDGEIADVVVCDGFVGNTVLKLAEGMYTMAQKEGLKNTYIDNFNYEKVGGTPVLGINSTVIIAHGCSSAKAIKNMILQTERTIKSQVTKKLREIFNQQ